MRNALEQRDAKQHHPSQRRKDGEERRLVLHTRLHIDAQAAFIHGIDQVRVMGQELIQTKLRHAESMVEMRSGSEARRPLNQGNSQARQRC